VEHTKSDILVDYTTSACSHTFVVQKPKYNQRTSKRNNGIEKKHWFSLINCTDGSYCRTIPW